jgi:hypothetical protein
MSVRMMKYGLKDGELAAMVGLDLCHTVFTVACFPHYPTYFVVVASDANARIGCCYSGIAVAEPVRPEHASTYYMLTPSQITKG